ncbi:MAG: response regulator [Elainellaceae cyanobacterium]
MQPTLPSLLLVEDSASDASLFRQYVRRSRLTHDMVWVETGEQALMYLRREGQYRQVPRPSLIVLDLNLPGIDGQGVLAMVKSDPMLRQIPVVVFTGSNNEADVCRAYDLYANCYLQKPVEIQDYASTLGIIEEFWFGRVLLPSERCIV